MINTKVEEILNEQINKEFYSAYLYLAMSAHFDEIGLRGFCHWTKVQAREDYPIARNGNINLKQIEAPQADFQDPLQIFEKIYEHEKSVTSSIECVAYMSEDECDMATRNFIDWYIAEQVEEEATVFEIIKKLQMFGSDKTILYHLDKELAQREYKQHKYA